MGGGAAGPLGPAVRPVDHRVGEEAGTQWRWRLPATTGKRRGIVRWLLTHPTLRRFAKFAIVGASSTLIDMGLFWAMVRQLGWGETLLMRIVANSISFTLGVTNGFLWNRYWTFTGA